MALVTSLWNLIRHPFVRQHFSQGWRFAVCGVLGFVIDLTTLTILVERFDFAPDVAYTPSVLFAVVFVFLGNKFFTFRNRAKNLRSQVLKFSLVYGAAVIMNISISTGLYWIGFQYQFAKVIAIAIGAVWNYSLSHLFVFRRDPPDVAIV